MVFDYFQLFRWFFYMLIENYRKRYQNQLLLEWLKIIENDWKPSKIIFLTCCKLNSRYCAIGMTWVAKINLVFFLTQSQDGLLNRFFYWFQPNYNKNHQIRCIFVAVIVVQNVNFKPANCRTLATHSYLNVYAV